MAPDAREITLKILLDMEKNKTLSSIALNKALRTVQFSDKKMRAQITRLTEGVTEYRLLLDYYIEQYSDRKPKKLRPQVRSILRMGVYQILYMDGVPDSAACDEAVKMMKRHGLASLSGYVNGVLRTIAREKNHLEAPKEPWISYSVPEWLWNFLLDTYGKAQTEKILHAQFEEKMTAIRCNRTRIQPEKLEEKLLAAGIAVQKGRYSDSALLIDGYDFIRKIPGFREGEFSVQDESSMCALEAVPIRNGDTVIDLCAAPGGKTCYAAEIMNHTGSVISRDLTAEKTELIKDNINRLRLTNVTVSEHDALEYDSSLEQAGDVVIADVPCSGLGIIGRKNDIKYRMTPEDMKNLETLGLQILSMASKYVKCGGCLLFSTCTINPGENGGTVEKFLTENKNFEKLTERTFLQGIDACDGFYYCVMRRNQ